MGWAQWGTVAARRARAIAALAFLLGAAAGFLAGRVRQEPEGRDLEIRGTRRAFTNPLLDCEVEHASPGRELRPFREDIEALIGRLTGTQSVTTVAVYFRDLDNGPWFGIDERQGFTPGSLYKIPIIIAALRQAEVDPGFLDRQVPFPGLPADTLGTPWYPPGETIEAGREYPIIELLHRIAAHSDNGAAWLVRKTIRPEILAAVFTDLGFDPGRIEAGGRTLSAKDHGRFFRILYNASYLSRPLSELALSLFSEAEFRDGLVAGVPPGTPVAHKFGEVGRVAADGRPALQLHDCGIVYHPSRPYLLCVMTEGNDYGALAGAIAAVSREVYGAITLQLGPALTPRGFP